MKKVRYRLFSALAILAGLATNALASPILNSYAQNRTPDLTKREEQTPKEEEPRPKPKSPATKQPARRNQINTDRYIKKTDQPPSLNKPGVMGRLGLGSMAAKLIGGGGSTENYNEEFSPTNLSLHTDLVGFNSGKGWSTYFTILGTQDNKANWQRTANFAGVRVDWNLQLSKRKGVVISQLHAGLLLGITGVSFAKVEQDGKTSTSSVTFTGTGYGITVGYDHLLIGNFGLSLGIDWFTSPLSKAIGSSKSEAAAFQRVADKSYFEAGAVYLGLVYLLNFAN